MNPSALLRRRRSAVAGFLALLALTVAALLEGGIPEAFSGAVHFIDGFLRYHGYLAVLGLLSLEEAGVPLPLPGDVVVMYVVTTAVPGRVGRHGRAQARDGRRNRSRHRREKRIERAHRVGEALGLAVWNQDEAGPYQTLPYPGASWQPEGEPAHRPHKYVRAGTAKLLTLFHPATGEVRVAGVTSTTNAILHGWLKEELTAILATLPDPVAPSGPQATRALWAAWRVGLTATVTFPAELPPSRMLLIFDNLVGHTSADQLCWLFAHGVMPLYTPLGGSWLNMAESIQRILKHRALDGQHPKTPQEIIDALEATARAWNRAPTPFVWGGSGAVTTHPIHRCRAKARYSYTRDK